MKIFGEILKSVSIQNLAHTTWAVFQWLQCPSDQDRWALWVAFNSSCLHSPSCRKRLLPESKGPKESSDLEVQRGGGGKGGILSYQRSFLLKYHSLLSLYSCYWGCNWHWWALPKNPKNGSSEGTFYKSNTRAPFSASQRSSKEMYLCRDSI